MHPPSVNRRVPSPKEVAPYRRSSFGDEGLSASGSDIDDGARQLAQVEDGMLRAAEAHSDSTGIKSAKKTAAAEDEGEYNRTKLLQTRT